MFELPECKILAGQMNSVLPGKVIQRGSLGNSPHKFVWYNRSPADFKQLTDGKQVGEAQAQGRWIFIPLEPGYVLVLGECGGKVLYHEMGATAPQKYHLFLTFEDGSFLTVMTQMWGAMELYVQGQERERPYIKGMRPTPVDAEFTFGYFNALIDQLIAKEKRSAKSLLTQDQLIPGLGNAIAQDILFRACLHPRHPLDDLSAEQRLALYNAIQETISAVIAQGGRYDEIDLFGRPGGYIRLMDNKAVGNPCPGCGNIVTKIQYLGGACYFCSNCQT